MVQARNVVISGGGPSAYLDAWVALKNGKTVMLVSDRSFESERFQRVSLDPENKEYLLNMLKNDNEFRKLEVPRDDKDIKFLVELMNSSSIAVKDVEDFLKRRLNELNTAEQLVYVEKSRFKKININDRTVTIEPINPEIKSEERQVKFDYVICADGNNHHAVKVLNENLAADQPPITYKEMAKPTHPYHANAYITIERKDHEELEIPAKQVVSEADSQGLISVLTFHPVSKSFADEKKETYKKRIKCFINGEVPKEIYDAIKIRNENLSDDDLRQQQEKQITDYFQNKIQNSFQHRNLNDDAELNIGIKNTGEHNDKLRAQAFDVNPFMANQVGLELNEDEFMVVTGDAARGSNYQLGFGFNNAFDHARRLGDVFKGKKTIAKYNSESECNSILPSFEFTTLLTNFGCFRRFFPSGIESAIEKKHNEFLIRCAPLLADLRKQAVIREAEAKLDLPRRTAEADSVGVRNTHDEYQRLLLMTPSC